MEDIDFLLNININNSTVYSLDFSPDEKYIAFCLDKGEILIFSLQTKQCVLSFPSKPLNDAITCVKWRIPNNNFLTKNIFTYATSKGLIESYHMNTQKRLFKIQEKIDGDPSINQIEYSPDQNELAVVGSDPLVRIYDVQTQQLKSDFNCDDNIIPGHSNRIFSVKYEKDSGLLITSGWDQRIIFWDLRMQKPVESIFGSNIYGDGLDCCDGLLLTANHRDNAQIQLYDLNSRKLVTAQDGSDFPWITSYLHTTDNQTLLNFGKFDHLTKKYIFAGGTQQQSEKEINQGNEAKIFDITNKHYVTFKNFDGGIICGNFSCNNNYVAYGTSNGLVKVFGVKLP